MIAWDAVKVPAALRDYEPAIARGPRILIPGCGSGYEAAYLASGIVA